MPASLRARGTSSRSEASTLAESIAAASIVTPPSRTWVSWELEQPNTRQAAVITTQETKPSSYETDFRSMGNPTVVRASNLVATLRHGHVAAWPSAYENAPLGVTT